MCTAPTAIWLPSWRRCRNVFWNAVCRLRGLLAHVLVSKYCDPLPLYRQESIYSSRHGVQLPRQTLARWVELAADWLRPV